MSDREGKPQETPDALTVTLSLDDWVWVLMPLRGVRHWGPEAVEAIEAAIALGEAMVRAGREGDGDDHSD